METIKRIVLLALFGALMGVVTLFLIGWLYAKGSLFSPFMTWHYWNDLIIPAAILGALTAPFFFTIKGDRVVIQTSSQKKRIGLLLLIGVGSFLGWQINRNHQEVDNRYTELCTLLEKKDYTTAYTYMSPSYQQMEKSKLSMVSFAQMCSYWNKRFVTIIGNRSIISDQTNFSGVGMVTSVNLEKIDNQWYFISQPFISGID